MTNPISDKQLAANRANAQKSTGPRAEGKKRSSQNALDHGLWARELSPISSGPFREDPEAFYERVEEIMADLNPTGTAQMMAAKRAAAALMRLDRTDRAEATLIIETDLLEGMESDLYPDTDILLEQLIEIETVVKQIGYIAGTSTDTDDRPLWAFLAIHLRRYGPKPTIFIEDLWTKDRLPVDETEWKKAAQTLFETLWTSEQECLFYFLPKQGDAEQAYARATARYDALMARRMLGATTNHIDRPRTAAWTEFNRAYGLLRRLQADDTDTQ